MWRIVKRPADVLSVGRPSHCKTPGRRLHPRLLLPTPPYAGPGDVACDFCSGRKLTAVKSCLQCLVSYCEQHLRPHYESPAFVKHKLVDPSSTLQENICTRHNEVMKIFCRTDQQCICYLCSMDEHRGHDTVSAVAEMTEKQRELGARRQNIQQRILNGEKNVKMLQQDVEAINRTADKAVKDSEKILADVKQHICSRQKSEVVRVNGLQEKLKQEIAELRRKDAELEKLSHTEDHSQFLHNYTLLSRPSEATDSTLFSSSSLLYTEDVTAAVSEAREKLQAFFSQESQCTVSLKETEIDVLPPQEEPKTRNEFLQYSCKMTLDQNTANTCVDIGGKYARHYQYNGERYRRHPDRFAYWPQVLCRENLTGRCYWEVELCSGEAFIAVAYKDISRKEAESAFGDNNKSWALQCFSDGYEFRHNKIRTPVSGPTSSRVGVYLNHSAGILSFYSVSETMVLLHRVQTTFTRPLCPGFGLYDDARAEFCESLRTEDEFVCE